MFNCQPFKTTWTISFNHLSHPNGTDTFSVRSSELWQVMFLGLCKNERYQVWPEMWSDVKKIFHVINAKFLIRTWQNKRLSMKKWWNFIFLIHKVWFSLIYFCSWILIRFCAMEIQPKIWVSFEVIRRASTFFFILMALLNCVRITKHMIAALFICKVDSLNSTICIRIQFVGEEQLTLKQNFQSNSKRPHVNLNFSDEICSTSRRV